MARAVRRKTKKTTRKTTRKTAAKARPRKRAVPKAPKASQADLSSTKDELQVKGGQLVVRISRESHPEIFDLDRLIKQVRKMIKAHGRKRTARDLHGFLVETDKSLEIILRNHLENAMRKYLD